MWRFCLLWNKCPFFSLILHTIKFPQIPVILMQMVNLGLGLKEVASVYGIMVPKQASFFCFGRLPWVNWVLQRPSGPARLTLRCKDEKQLDLLGFIPIKNSLALWHVAFWQQPYQVPYFFPDLLIFFFRIETINIPDPRGRGQIRNDIIACHIAIFEGQICRRFHLCVNHLTPIIDSRDCCYSRCLVCRGMFCHSAF